MTGWFDRLIGQAQFRRLVRQWQDRADGIDEADLGAVRQLRGQAKLLRRALDRVLHRAEGRLALPAIGSNAIHKPLMADWAWRPELWRGPIAGPGIAAVENRTAFGDEVTVFHDCRESELTLRQVRNSRQTDLAPFGLRLDVFKFDGSFLSLAIALPEDLVRSMRLHHVLRVDCTIEMERPLEIFARLNVRHGPNTEQIVRELPVGSGEPTAEFDLFYTKMNEKRVERAWLDLIFEGPEMNQVTLRDLTMTRRPRSEL